MGQIDNKAKGGDASKKEMSPGQIKESLPKLEIEVLEFEGKVRKLEAMKLENRVLKKRLLHLNQALYAFLKLAYQPNTMALKKIQMEIIQGDLQDFYSRGKS